MQCGTPVVAFARAAWVSSSTKARTGFVVDDTAGATAALRRVPGLDRSRDRARARAIASRHAEWPADATCAGTPAASPGD